MHGRSQVPGRHVGSTHNSLESAVDHPNAVITRVELSINPLTCVDRGDNSDVVKLHGRHYYASTDIDCIQEDMRGYGILFLLRYKFDFDVFICICITPEEKVRTL